MTFVLISLLPLFLFAAAAVDASHFECVTTNDLDVRKLATRTYRKHNKEACEKLCASLHTCRAYAFYHHRCYLIPPVFSWSEDKRSYKTEICIKPYQKNPNCNKKNFPYALGRSRYAYIRAKKTWNAAATNCEKMDSKLAQLTTEEERNFIKYILHTNHADRFTFNGLLKKPGYKGSRKSGWIWHRSGDYLLPGFWHPGEPNNAGGKQDVGAFYKNGKLDDANSWASLSSICECFVI